jgi:hypothetical protein
MRALGFVVVALAVAARPAPASADVFKLFAELHAGGMYGTGTSGEQKDKAFFANAPNGDFGFLLGAELVVFDAWIQHHEFTDGSHLSTWTQFGLGIHTQVSLGSDAEQKAGKGTFLEFGTGAWFGLGTGQQVMPPLDNAQVTDKGFLLEGRFGFGGHINKILDFGLTVPVSYGYFFKNGNGAAANNLSTHYRGWELEGLAYLRANVHLF